ncbi:TetR/AcrR family transcriptional regulator [Rhizobium wenxiniae]|uniref:TetR/AcrR family transcriptional regulator n=1 Tax=Rhizobium wenxiniae TaxID=1737357 RepID=UPI003C18490F
MRNKSGHPGRPRGFDRQEALGRAQRLFRRHGYEAVSIAKLTDEIGIAPPSLYAAFGSKAELFREAVLSYRADDGIAPVKCTGTGQDRVRASLLRSIEVVTHDKTTPGCMISTGMLTAAPENETLAREVREHRNAFRKQVERWIQGDVAA